MKLLKKIFKWLGIAILSVVAILTIVVIAGQNKKFDAPYPKITASTDSAVIANGRYLFYGPAHCMDCHGNRNLKPGDAAASLPTGGFKFDLPIGVLHAPNITSDKETGIGNLTDEQIARTLRYGVGSDGRAILDFMPFHNTSDEDLTAIISFIRTLPPVKHEVPRIKFNILGNIVKVFMLKPTGPTTEVPKTVAHGPTVEYGKYLANSVANCRGCHTDRDLMTGEFIGKDFAGGFHIEAADNSGNIFVTRNLTPDPKTGHIFNWTEDQFIARFRKGKLIPGSPMPWEPFQSMSDDDLRAIYRYLHTVTPVNFDAGPPIVAEAK